MHQVHVVQGDRLQQWPELHYGQLSALVKLERYGACLKPAEKGEKESHGFASSPSSFASTVTRSSARLNRSPSTRSAHWIARATPNQLLRAVDHRSAEGPASRAAFALIAAPRAGRDDEQRALDDADARELEVVAARHGVNSDSAAVFGSRDGWRGA